MRLEDIRDKIDTLDDQIILLLEKRFETIKRLKELKLKKQVEDSSREEEILKKISSKYIQKIYLEIFKNSKELQN